MNGWHTVVDPVFIMSRNQDSIAIKSQVSILDGRINPSLEDLESGYSRTIRYNDNGEKKIERGYLIKQNCMHLTFDSLRGEIKSVPRFGRESGDKSC